MLTSVIKYVTPHFTRLKNSTVFIILTAVSFLVRFPFFFRDYIDRDESTFILMGQSWLEGNLPYTELWDLKPPLAFLFFAAIIYVFGKSFFAIRFAGVIIVSLSAFFTFKIGKRFSSKKVAFAAAIACVLLQSLFGSIQGVMSEHICMAFLTPAIYLIITSKKWYSIGVAGLLIGIALMIKLNLAYVALFIGFYLIYYFIRQKKIKYGIAAVIAYGSGIITVILLTVLPYYLNGMNNLWWKSVIIAPLDYAGSRRYSIVKLLPTFLIVAAFLVFLWKKKYVNIKDTSFQILVISLLGILYSFFKGGRINSHYLIQLYPIFIVIVAIVYGKMWTERKFKFRKGILVLLLLIPAESYLEYYRIIKHKIEKGSFYNGEGITVPKYIVQENIDTENILFLEYHIGYWLLNKKPPTKAATHPSNICKPEMFAAYDNPRKTALEEIRYIMETIKPKTVVIRKNRRVFDKLHVEENSYINSYLQKHYAKPITVDKAEILVRLE